MEVFSREFKIQGAYPAPYPREYKVLLGNIIRERTTRN